MTPTFFKGPADFRKWLAKHHEKETELLVGFYKVESGKCSMTWSQSVDEALCFGWIDGVRKSIDKDSYTIRFTPRKKGSNWSAVNIAKVEALTKGGLMQPAGIASFQMREEAGSAIYSYENDEVKFPLSFEKKFKSNTIAWKYFQSLAPSYKKASKNWVMSAKQEITRMKRLDKLIADSQAGINEWKSNKYNKPRNN
ncbi:MAG TPA: YdeI/OmpD-associated family protein [Chitinophagaceae bacterium]|nr:YdeI/OmpD-associated family protein [Chitinophagaceae bacterium]